MAVLAVGSDIVSVVRIQSVIENAPKFAERILTTSELDLYSHRTEKAEFLAGRWAAKEAVKKCCAFVESWHDVEVLGTGLATVKNLPTGEQVLVSLSHEREFAIAFALRQTI